MPTVEYISQPVNQVSDMQGNYPRAFELVRRILTQMNGLLIIVAKLFTIAPGSGGGGGGSGGGPGATLATRVRVRWTANGPYRVDDEVDGAWVPNTACQITGLTLWRGEAGRSGSTILDLRLDGVTMYSIITNRPTIGFADASRTATCPLPNTVNIPAHHEVTVHTLAKETGKPQHWVLELEGA